MCEINTIILYILYYRDIVIDDDEDSPHYKKLRKCMILGIAYAANTGGIGTMTGSASNMVLVGAMEK